MIKNILWDFDGVILDSMKIKGDGFKELFKAFDKENINKIQEYHYENGGISRFEKIKYFYNNLLNKQISVTKINSLADQFSQIIEKSMFDKNALIIETLAFIKNNYKKFNFHIVSGSDQEELLRLCNYLELNEYFRTINGSPTIKSELIKNILKKYDYKNNETILIGDSENDYNAATSNEIDFYGYNNCKLKNKSNYIHAFEGLSFE